MMSSAVQSLESPSVSLRHRPVAFLAIVVLNACADCCVQFDKSSPPSSSVDTTATTNSLVGVLVGMEVGAAEGLVVGTLVGIEVGAAEGAVEGAVVGATVGDDVGAQVGAAVGVELGAAVGAEVGGGKLQQFPHLSTMVGALPHQPKLPVSGMVPPQPSLSLY